MLIVEKCEKEENNFFTNFENSLNNVYLSCDMNMNNNTNNFNNNINNINTIYDLEKKIQKNKLIKIKKIVNGGYNYTKPPYYNKENNKNNKDYKSKNTGLNCKHVINYKKLI